MINSKPRVCIIGAGPGGFSSANIFLANGFEVEIFEEGIDTQGKKFSSLIFFKTLRSQECSNHILTALRNPDSS